MAFQAHLNDEWCNKSRAINYLFKYLHKGPNRATMVIEDNVLGNRSTNTTQITMVDEVKTFLDCRYVKVVIRNTLIIIIVSKQLLSAYEFIFITNRNIYQQKHTINEFITISSFMHYSL